MTITELSEKIIRRAKSPTTILVQCNNARPIIEAALLASKKLPSHNVYYQINSDFLGDLTIATAKDYEQQFKDYCNYFDNHRVALILRINKRLYNYSKNNEKIDFTDYPNHIKMLLIVENYNFLDLNSQVFIATLPEKKPNIIVLCQIRNDFDFATHHIDIGVRSGKGGASFVELEDNNKANTKLSEDQAYQKKNLDAIYRDASFAPVFKKNPTYCIGKFADATPYVSYDDVMDNKFIIRARPLGEEINSFDSQAREIIKEYHSSEDLVNDGWRLD